MTPDLLLALLSAMHPAHAEGSDQLGTNQELLDQTVLFVDILDFASESVVWTSEGATVDVYDPSGVFVATLASGDAYLPAVDGSFRLELSESQFVWDVTVTGSTVGAGRLWSTRWELEAANWSEPSAMNGSMYALVDGGGAGFDGVVEFRAEGWAGLGWIMRANRSGVDGASGRSVPAGTGTLVDEFPIYLNPPEAATYTVQSPVIAGEAFSAGSQGCTGVVPAVTVGAFSFDSNVEGTSHVLCDLNGDGEFEVTDDADLHLITDAVLGLNEVPWDGLDNGGSPVVPGDYTCELWLNVGEFHYVAEDVETSFGGFRLFSVDDAGLRTGLPMYWNDEDVQANARPMPSGELGLVRPGPGGMDSGSDIDLTVPNVNARSWGDFSGSGKANKAWMDTYTWLRGAVSAPLSIQVYSGAEASDSDGLFDHEERCETGTDPLDADTDDDGLADDVEVDGSGVLAAVGATDALNIDSDSDGLADGLEAGLDASGVGPDTDLTVFVADADAGATTTDPTLPDTDGDGVLDADEDLDRDGAIDPATVVGGTGTMGAGETDPNDSDSDGDGVSDGDERDASTSPLDTDTDDGGVPDGTEAGLGTDPLDPLDDDTDADGLTDADEGVLGTDPLDPDSDADGVEDGEEVTLGTDPLVDDSDMDGLLDGEEVTLGTDPLASDSDDDGLLDGEEVTLGTNPLDEDTDQGGVPDGAEVDAGSDPLDPADDNPITTGPTDPTDPTEDPPEGRYVGGSGINGCNTTGGGLAGGWFVLILCIVGVRRSGRA